MVVLENWIFIYVYIQYGHISQIDGSGQSHIQILDGGHLSPCLMVLDNQVSIYAYEWAYRICLWLCPSHSDVAVVLPLGVLGLLYY